MFSTLYICLHGANANIYQTSYFTSSTKPLECHEIKRLDARSTVDCALHCLNDIYSCAGSVNDRHGNNHVRCDVCFIHDVDTPVTTINASNSTVTSMPEINKESG